MKPRTRSFGIAFKFPEQFHHFGLPIGEQVGRLLSKRFVVTDVRKRLIVIALSDIRQQNRDDLHRKIEPSPLELLSSLPSRDKIYFCLELGKGDWKINLVHLFRNEFGEFDISCFWPDNRQFIAWRRKPV